MIKTIPNVTIDGANRAFGGYIYSVDYNANFAEQPSVLKIYIVNESGVYNISKEDLTTQGSPVQIKIGTKITLFMYPMSYSYEDSPDGKLLQVEYLDESIVFLDKVVVKLREPSRIVNQVVVSLPETYENTIILGSEDYSLIELTDAGIRSGLELGGYVDKEIILNHAPINYTFPELLEKIASFVAVIPSLDKTANKYRKDFNGRLREVLSAWCNDLGLGFYWENRKLNFIDLRNPANLSAVKSLADSIKEQNKVVNFNESFSLRDTFTRAIHGTNYKNGEVQSATTIGTGADTNYYLSNILIDNIPWDGNISHYVTGTNAKLRINAARYGIAFFKTMSFVGSDYIGKDIQDAYDQTKIAYKLLASKTNGGTTPTLDRITETTGIAPTDYNWYSYTYSADANLEKNFKVYESLAKFIGRFYVFGISSEERGKKLFGDDVKWYPRRKSVKSIDQIMNILEPVAEKITGLVEGKLSLQQFLNKGLGDSALSNSEIEKLTASNSMGTEGYIIKEINPVWSPAQSNSVIAFGNYVLIEGKKGNADFEVTFWDDSGPTGSYPIFYLGVKRGLPPDRFDSTSIKQPSTAQILVTSTDLGFVPRDNPNIIPKSSQFIYRPPETANVNYYDLNRIDISEDIIDQYGSFTDAVTNEEAGIPQQIDPFFSSQITVPNIDLAGSITPKLGTGLQSFSISYSDNGVKASYTIGTEKMRLRNTDVFYRYIYDPRKKRQDIVAMSTISIKSKRNYNKIT
jgi:hypothetical protein